MRLLLLLLYHSFFARGRSRNGTIASMVEQAREVAAKGGKEIVLTGVNIGDFGKSTGETFIDLIRALDEVEGIVRYRISSIEPNLITDEAIDFVASSKRFALTSISLYRAEATRC